MESIINLPARTGTRTRACRASAACLRRRRILGPGISFLTSQGFNTFSQAVQANKPPVVSPTIQPFGTPNFYLPSAGRAPYFVDWQFTVERNFWNNSVLRATYHATIGNKLLTRLTTLNQLDPKYLSIYGALLSAPLSTALNNPLLAANGFRLPYAGYPLNLPLSQALRPFPQYGNIDMSSGGDNSGHMTYHALEASFEHRFGIGLFLLASYTFEKTLTNAADSENPFQSNGPAQNSYNLAAEKSVASTDTPQNLRISTVYDLPVGRGRKFLSSMPKGLEWAFGGWKVSGDPDLCLRTASYDRRRSEYVWSCGSYSSLRRHGDYRRDGHYTRQLRSGRRHDHSADQSSVEFEPDRRLQRALFESGGVRVPGEWAIWKYAFPRTLDPRGKNHQ